MSPRTKLIAAAAALALLLVLATVQGLSTTAAARALLTLAALAGLAWWWFKSATPKKFQVAPRLSVVSRAGLSQRTGLALIEVDGRSFLIVHGDGYAEICPTAERAAPKKVRTQRATESFPKLNPEIAR
jgi:flagellar biogenesis protein FliO